LLFHSARTSHIACESGDQTVRSSSGSIFDIGDIRETLTHHLRLGQTLPNSTGLLRCGASTSQQMENEQHDAHEEGDVNESGGNVKCEITKQPKHDQNCGD
jgi:hypothetical protein